MSKTPESCLGGLIKDIDEEMSPDDYYSLSKDSTSKNIKDQQSSLDSMYTFNSLIPYCVPPESNPIQAAWQPVLLFPVVPSFCHFPVLKGS